MYLTRPDYTFIYRSFVYCINGVHIAKFSKASFITFYYRQKCVLWLLKWPTNSRISLSHSLSRRQTLAVHAGMCLSVWPGSSWQACDCRDGNVDGVKEDCVWKVEKFAIYFDFFYIYMWVCEIIVTPTLLHSAESERDSSDLWSYQSRGAKWTRRARWQPPWETIKHRHRILAGNQ